MILPIGAQVAEEREHERILAPGVIADPLPAFPAGLEGDVDVHVCVGIVITRHGEVGSVVQLENFPGCEPVDSAASRVLYPAVARTIRQWQFFAGGSCWYDRDKSECDARGARIEPMAMKLAYSFHFTRKAGVESVSSSARSR